MQSLGAGIGHTSTATATQEPALLPVCSSPFPSCCHSHRLVLVHQQVSNPFLVKGTTRSPPSPSGGEAPPLHISRRWSNPALQPSDRRDNIRRCCKRIFSEGPPQAHPGSRASEQREEKHDVGGRWRMKMLLLALGFPQHGTQPRLQTLRCTMDRRDEASSPPARRGAPQLHIAAICLRCPHKGPLDSWVNDSLRPEPPAPLEPAPRNKGTYVWQRRRRIKSQCLLPPALPADPCLQTSACLSPCPDPRLP